MTAVITSSSAQRCCPAEDCRAEWKLLPTAMGLAGYQPTMHKCRRCDRWWWLVYRVSLGRGIRWELVRILPSLGRHPERVRQALRGAPELDEDTIELTAELVTLQPRLATS